MPKPVHTVTITLTDLPDESHNFDLTVTCDPVPGVYDPRTPALMAAEYMLQSLKRTQPTAEPPAPAQTDQQPPAPAPVEPVLAPPLRIAVPGRDF